MHNISTRFTSILKAHRPATTKGRKKKCRRTTPPTPPNHQTCRPFTRLAPPILHRNFRAHPTSDICNLRRLATRRDHHTRHPAPTFTTRARCQKIVTSRPSSPNSNSSSSNNFSSRHSTRRFPSLTASHLVTWDTKGHHPLSPTPTLLNQYQKI